MIHRSSQISDDEFEAPSVYQSNDNIESKEEYTDQDMIQSSSTPDPEHHMESDKNTRKHHIQQRSSLSQELTTKLQKQTTKYDHQTRNTNNKKDPQKNHNIGTVSLKITGELKHV